MESVPLIVEALAAGASAGAIEGLTGDVKELAKAAYAKLYDLARKRLGGDAAPGSILAGHQADPAACKVQLARELGAAGAGGDAEVVAAARELMGLIDPAGTAAGKYSVIISDSKGVYVGDRGIQVNRFET
jgi:roadblock/LC7 domain-containing protein